MNSVTAVMIDHWLSKISLYNLNYRRNRCQDLNSCSFRELEDTTRMPSYYANEDYSAGPEMQ